ncbi:Transcriptional regulator, MarR family (plasmid) [Roseomonas mucosa]|uniref:Multiple antibiotic resistance protein marR n=1 Tax=Roseomonas mucosa TaxID=207340 RepID=A0A379PNF2_9PROT|nr:MULTISPECIES: MarR family transcriptional regulator [Roseomonas]MCG7351810.1 MarR family transcriptional regulator [Roseomonas mucosa]MCG7357405.1 MarR family transcriptional regulator [Roseomonas mucosa]MDT8291937.1 MarR family transcriptional regulator [Roseomonas mucosa]MDT8295828.1 MarR family transcriptional regulator [Roseomonas mucosa]MDT8315946.1 MarR family transcriptional regulator [Roseomonas mucosa]
MPIGSMYEMPGHLIRRAHQISGAIFTARLAGFDITSVQYAAMVAIASQPGIDATRLSDLIAFDRATLGGVLDRLEAKGLIARQPSRQDRRVKTITLTVDGSALLETVKDRVLAAQAEMMHSLSEAEQAQFIALLKKFVGRVPEED